jgi:hypothetical protein
MNVSFSLYVQQATPTSTPIPTLTTFHSPLFDHPNSIGWGVQIRSCSLWIFLQFPVASPVWANRFLSTLLSDSFGLRSSLSVRDMSYKRVRDLGPKCECTENRQHALENFSHFIHCTSSYVTFNFVRSFLPSFISTVTVKLHKWQSIQQTHVSVGIAQFCVLRFKFFQTFNTLQ